MSRLKQLRKNKDLTQLQVQLKTGIDQSNYSKMESGKRKPTSDQAELLSYKQHKSFDYLLKKYDLKVQDKYILYTKDLLYEDGITYLPIYMAGLIWITGRFFG